MRVSILAPVCGRFCPAAMKKALSPFASAGPSSKTDRGADGADDQRFEHDRAEHLAARRAERSQRGELARPLRDGRRQRVEDDESADEEREAAEGEHELPDQRDVLVRALGLSRNLGLAGRDFGAVGQDRRDRLHELLLRDAFLRGDEDLVEAAGLAEELLRRGRV